MMQTVIHKIFLIILEIIFWNVWPVLNRKLLQKDLLESCWSCSRLKDSGSCRRSSELQWRSQTDSSPHWDCCRPCRTGRRGIQGHLKKNKSFKRADGALHCFTRNMHQDNNSIFMNISGWHLSL